MWRVIPALVAAFAIALAGPAHAQVPAGGLPPGDGREALTKAGTQCHNLSVIVAMREGTAGWRRHVYNMVLRGAQLNWFVSMFLIICVELTNRLNSPLSQKGMSETNVWPIW